MFEDVKIGDKFKLKVNGSPYEVYQVHGRGKKYVPSVNEVTVFLKLTSRSFFSFGATELFSVPETELHLFFEKVEVNRV